MEGGEARRGLASLEHADDSRRPLAGLMERASDSVFVPRHVSATPMSAGFEAAPEEARRAVVRDVSEQLGAYETGQGIRVPFRTHLVMGIK